MGLESIAAITIFQKIQILINLLGVIVIPFVIQALRTRSSALTLLGVKIDQSQVAALSAAGKVEEVARLQAEDIRLRLERIENGLLERIGRVEIKLDDHIQWHLAGERT